MDWPGAQELSQRLAKTIDPKLIEDSEKSPALQAAEMQMQAMAQEVEQLHKMLQSVQQSMEAQELEIKKYDAETKRISAVQAGMTPEQIQDIVMGTIAAAIDTGDISPGAVPDRGQMMPDMGGMPEGAPV
jgi:TolA-binding protein